MVKELFLDASGKEISHTKYQQVSEQLEEMVTVILWKKGDLQPLFLNMYFRKDEIMAFAVSQCFLYLSVRLGR